MFLLLCYVALRWMLQLAALRCQSNEVKDLEIVLLRHELAILQRQIWRPTMTWTDRSVLAAASRLLPRAQWRSFIVTPATLLRWHRRLVAKRGPTPVESVARRFDVRFARRSFASRGRIRGGAISASLAS